MNLVSFNLGLFVSFTFLLNSCKVTEDKSVSVLIISAIIAAIAGILTTRITTYFSLKSKPLEAYSATIQEKRLANYEYLYELLSDLGKLIFRNNENTINAEELRNGLKNIYHKIESYDSKVSFYFSKRTNLISFHFRKNLQLIVYNDNFNYYIIHKEELETFRKNFASQFEANLKLDIGIYEIDEYNSKRDFSYFTYQIKEKRKLIKEKQRIYKAENQCDKMEKIFKYD